MNIWKYDVFALSTPWNAVRTCAESVPLHYMASNHIWTVLVPVASAFIQRDLRQLVKTSTCCLSAVRITTIVECKGEEGVQEHGTMMWSQQWMTQLTFLASNDASSISSEVLHMPRICSMICSPTDWSTFCKYPRHLVSERWECARRGSWARHCQSCGTTPYI